MSFSSTEGAKFSTKLSGKKDRGVKKGFYCQVI